MTGNVYDLLFGVNERYEPKELVGLLLQAVGEEGKEEMASVAEKLQEQGERKIVLKLLRTRFGELSEAVVARVNAADGGRLELWAERVLSAPTLADVLAEG